MLTEYIRRVSNCGGLIGKTFTMRLAVMAVVLVVASASVSSALAANYILVFPNWGNTVSVIYPSNNGSNCQGTGSNQPYNWQHNLAYSIETFSNPQRIQFKYVDFYGGSTTLPGSVNYRIQNARIIRQAGGGANYALNAMIYQPFNVYDVTVWPWEYITWANGLPPQVLINHAEFSSGGYNDSCASLSSVEFWPPGSY